MHKFNYYFCFLLWDIVLAQSLFFDFHPGSCFLFLSVFLLHLSIYIVYFRVSALFLFLSSPFQQGANSSVWTQNVDDV